MCEKCTAKLGSIVVPDKWKDGALNIIDDVTGKNKAGDRRVGSNALAARMSKSMAGDVARPCRICKTKVQQAHAHYCSACAYSKGICAMCGHKVRKPGMCAFRLFGEDGSCFRPPLSGCGH